MKNVTLVILFLLVTSSFSGCHQTNDVFKQHFGVPRPTNSFEWKAVTPLVQTKTKELADALVKDRAARDKLSEELANAREFGGLYPERMSNTKRCKHRSTTAAFR